MQVKKSQKIFEFFDFFEGVQRIFGARGGGALQNLVVGKKRGQKMRHGNFRATNPNASQGMEQLHSLGCFFDHVTALRIIKKITKAGRMRGKKSSTKSTKIILKIVSIFNPPQSAFLKSSIARIVRFCKFFENILTIRVYLIYLKGNKRKGL